MVFVKKTQGKTDDSLIREFSRKVLLEDIIGEARDRQHYYKPSARKKLKAEKKRRARKLW